MALRVIGWATGALFACHWLLLMLGAMGGRKFHARDLLPPPWPLLVYVVPCFITLSQLQRTGERTDEFVIGVCISSAALGFLINHLGRETTALLDVRKMARMYRLVAEENRKHREIAIESKSIPEMKARTVAMLQQSNVKEDAIIKMDKDAERKIRNDR